MSSTASKLPPLATLGPFIALILVLTLRPSGLLGERVADRA